jgi:amino acid adenylation domain-containing protein
MHVFEDGKFRPLSFAQERLFLLEDLWDIRPPCNRQMALRARGACRGELLSLVFTAILQRHEALRATFALRDGDPVQVVGPPRAVPVPVTDLSGLEDARRNEEVRRWAGAEARIPFRLGRGPLLRVRRLRLGSEDHIVLVTLHPIVSDGWSMNVLAREMVELYDAFSTERRAVLPALPLQYADFARWQREWLQGELVADRLAYWTGRLAGDLPVLDLPADRPRPAVRTFSGGRVPFHLSAGVADRLKSLGLREGGTLFMTLLGFFQVLLHRYTGETDLLVGSPFANRDRAGLEDLIGLFANPLVLRTDLTADPSFVELLSRVRDVVSGASTHQDLPFEKLMEALRPGWQTEDAVFQVAFTFERPPAGALDSSGLALEPFVIDDGAGTSDLTLEMSGGERGISGFFEYSRNRFEKVTVERLEEAFRALVGSALAEPGRRISELSLLGKRELELLRTEKVAAVDGVECLHALFERQAESSPDRVAVVCEGNGMTYGELDRRTNQLARHLRRLGVGPETLVGLYLERSPELVVAIVGILKTGAAYVPLDPSYPAERLELILRDTGSPVLITQGSLLSDLPAGRWRTLCLDHESETLRRVSAAPLVHRSLPDHLAYVIYTSGSTGRPKGVLITHANACRLFAASRPRFGFGEADVWTLFHSVAFDVSVWEIWGALLHGGRLVVVPRETVRSPEKLLELLAEEEVTVLSQTPSAFLPLTRAGRSRRDLSLRHVVFAGEALEAAALKPWADSQGDLCPRLINMYGITETTVHVTFHEVTAADLGGARNGRIGAPLADLRACVMDSRMEPLPVGVPGELCIGGAGLARGYLHRPELTAERFVPAPFGGLPGERLYRSGDLARRLPDGTFQYLGRIDQQVKIRGYRIELGEIEAALGRHPELSGVAAGTRREPEGELSPDGKLSLVAWFVPRVPSRIPRVDELRSFLRISLPDYMIPAAFVALREMPLTPNGKIDRRALPDPGPERPFLTSAYVGPASPAEATLAGIWEEVLGIESVGVNDNFFSLGGDSILSVRVKAIARQRGLSFEVEQLFSFQTVAELARAIDPAKGESPLRTSPLSLLSTADRAKLPPDVEDAYPLAAVQAGMLYHMRYMPDAIVYHNVYSYHLRMGFDAQAFDAAVQGTILRHPILRTSFDLTRYSEPLQQVHRTAVLPVRVEDLRALSPEDQEKVLDAFLESEKNQGFDLARPPLVRLALHRRCDETFNFSLTECHPILDGWSLHSFMAEVFETYLALLHGRALPEGAPPELTYRDFVALERGSTEAPDSRAYWAETLRDCSLLEIPRRREREPREKGGRIAVLSALLPEDLIAGLKRLARSSGVPLKNVLLAAHLIALQRTGGRRDVLTGLVCNGRPEWLDGDQILGLFFNTVPFRMLIEDGSWRDLARATFEGERKMFPHRRYPLARLQQSRGGKPLFEILFNYVHFHRLRPLLASGEVHMLSDFRRWEETNLPLSVTFQQAPAADALGLSLRYDAELFGAAAMQRLFALYQRILEAMAGDPEERHESRLLLAEAERHQLLHEWNDTRSAGPALSAVHELFEAQAGRSPEAPAVASGGESLSYAELNARADRLACRLQEMGIGPEDRVGLYLRRSREMIVALLGILKAGGAYVPLDPSHPRERLVVLLKEAAISVVLTEEDLAGDLDPGGLRILRLGAGGEDLSGGSRKSPRRLAVPESAAYVLFTSGSTGVPKAVVVEHRQVVSYVTAILERLEIPPAASFALVSTFSADLGNTAIFPSLCAGGCLHVMSEEQSADATALGEAFARHAVDVLKIVPSHLAALLSPGQPETRLLPRRRLILGGEALEAGFLRRLRALEPSCRIFNHYGPTETTVGVMTWRSGEGESAALGATAPLGRPIPGTEIYLLGADLRPVHPGAPGEIHVGGAGLARGYLGRPELTAESFIPNPYGSGPGARLYRTGDLARHLPDGNLEFLGRADFQVKIRGFRIELREIELTLSRHPAVREAVVELRLDGAGEKRLAAFCVAGGESLPAEGEIRSFLRRFLPEYMLPAAYLWLDALPRTANGKVDRGALPDVGSLFAPWRAVYVAPRNDLERRISGVWREVLQIDEVGMDDNFFDLGGHSLIMLRMHSTLRQVLERDVSMVTLFEHPTIGALAGHLSRGPEVLRSPEASDRADARHAAVQRRRAARSPGVAVGGGADE